MPDAQTLRALVVQRWHSIHAFCRAHPELTRSAVYMALADSYAGNKEKQLALIAAALHRPQPSPCQPSPEIVANALQAVRCQCCHRAGKPCRRCRIRTAEEAHELYARLYTV